MNKAGNYSRKVLVRPFTYITDSVAMEASKMIALLMVQVVMLFLAKSYSSVLIVLCTVAATVTADIISRKLFENRIFDDYSLLVSVLQGMITGMLVPSTYSPITVFAVTLITMLVIKHFFGGFSYAWVNPAVFTVVVLWIIGSRLFPAYLVNMDILAMRNPSQFMIENGVFSVFSFDSEITDALNSSIFSLFKVSIPDGYVSLFWDNQSVIPAFRFNFITLLSSIIIFSDNMIKSLIPGIFLVFYILLVRFVSPFICNGIMLQGDMLLSLLSGGTIFFAVFVIGWYGTTPISLLGKVLYGLFAGLIAFIIAGPGTSPCGMIFTVLITNIISVVIQQWDNRRDRKNLRRKLENFRKIQQEELKNL